MDTFLGDGGFGGGGSQDVTDNTPFMNTYTVGKNKVEGRK